ncbi:MAG: glycine--tRNA ligase subunit beta, partial [Pseudomonadota bacterium]
MSLTDHLLIEIGTEELPPKSIQKFAQAFANSVQEQLQQLSIAFEQVDAFATPRRIAIRVNDLMLKQPDTQQQRLGPAVAAAIKDGKPTPAATGFARSCGVTFEELEHIATDKGARLGYEVKTQGLPTKNFIEDIVNQAINKFPIPKAMRWGNSDETFSRPIHWIVALLGSETLPITVKGLVASNVSYGHRFHAPEAMMLTSPTAYEEQLEKAFVIASFEKRQAIIQQQVAAIAKEKNVTIVTEPDLLDEVTALVEWPVALLGSFDAEFLEVPRECVVSSMAEHQKYFHVTDAKGELQPLFVTVANIESKDPQAIIDGNEKVVRPRLADAKFFFTSDQKTSLEARLEKLKNIVFQAKLGTLYDKTERLQKLAITLAEQFKHTTAANVETLQRAALLSRCDLVTDMVGEFPELQGIMGAYYAKAQNETAAVAEALEDVYRPRFAADALPRSLESSVLAIADRLDTLVGIFGIKQAPTGAKDPFGLRRAALGIIRISIENQ